MCIIPLPCDQSLLQSSMTPGSRQPVQGRRLNPLFPLAATPDESKPFAPLQAVQHFASQVQTQVRSKFGSKDKDKSVSDTIADAAAATRAKPSESQTQARTLVKNLSNKGFVLAKSSQVSQGPDLGAVSPAAIVSKEELGRATWTMLHTLAVQYPQTPTKQQQKDVKTLVMCYYLAACSASKDECLTQMFVCRWMF